METQLRLADRRGLLQGPSLSRVQLYAVEIVAMLDARDAAKARGEQFRADLAAANPQLIEVLYPEWARKPEQAKVAHPDVDTDPARIEWSVPSSAEEEAEIAAWIAQNMGGTISATELEEGGWI